MNPFTHHEPEGFIAISRWSSAATPPVVGKNETCIPAGCQQGLRSLRDRITFTFTFTVRWCCSFLAQPPASGWHPSGMAKVSLDQHLQKMGAVWK